jgi:hypothetical protein
MSSTNSILLPESYSGYVSDEGRQRAYNLIGGMGVKLRDLPQHFPFEQTRSFYEAKFVLDVVKFDYYRCMCELWEKTWGESLPLIGERGKEFTVADYVADRSGDDYLSPDGVWDRSLSRAFKLTCGNECYDLWLSCCAHTNLKQLVLFIGLYNGADDVTGQKLGSAVEEAPWEKKDGGFQMKADLGRISLEQREVNIEPLQQAARNILTALASVCS